MKNTNEKPAKGGQGEEMNNLNDKLGLQGKYRTIVHRAATGKVETSEWKVNTIDIDLKTKVNDVLLVNSDFAMDKLFNGNGAPTAGEDGIVLYTVEDNYEMDCSSSKPTATSIKVTGTFTGVAGTFTAARLGQDSFGGAGFTVTYASPTAWDNVILAIADTLTIEWTITVGA